MLRRHIFFVMHSSPPTSRFNSLALATALGVIALDQLTSDLSEEIYYELSPKTRIKHLAKLYQRLSPDEEF